MEDIKKNHHYIPQFYLKSWVDPELFMLKDNQVIKRNPKTIAKERYFYRIESLSKNDVLFIEAITDSNSDQSKKVNESWLKIYTTLTDMTSAIESNPEGSPQDVKLVKEVRTNTDENLFSYIEDDFKTIIESTIKNRKLPNDDNILSSLSFYLGIQYFRTKRMKDGFFQGIRSALDNKDMVLSDERRKYYESLNLNAIWSVLSKDFATNIGMYIYSNSIKNGSLHLLHNNTSVPFLTGDQPAINLRVTGNYKSDEQPSEFELYFPISPTLAILFSINDTFSYLKNKNGLTESEVEFFNDKIVAHSLEQVYSNNRALLERYIITYEQQ